MKRIYNEKENRFEWQFTNDELVQIVKGLIFTSTVNVSLHSDDYERDGFNLLKIAENLLEESCGEIGITEDLTIEDGVLEDEFGIDLLKGLFERYGRAKI